MKKVKAKIVHVKEGQFCIEIDMDVGSIQKELLWVVESNKHGKVWVTGITMTPKDRRQDLQRAKSVTLPLWATHIAVDTVGQERPKPCALDAGEYLCCDPSILKEGDWVDILAKYRWKFFSRIELKA